MSTVLDGTKTYILIPGSSDQKNINELVSDLGDRRINISTKYDTKLRYLQDTYYNHQNDDIKLQNLFDSEKQAQIEKDTQYFMAYQNKQNQELNTVMKQLHELQGVERSLYSSGMKYSSVQSFKGQTLALTPVNDNYMININNNCLHIDSGSNKFTLQICNKNSFGQKFDIIPIFDQISFHKVFNTQPNQDIIDQFPFNVIKSKVNGLCITDNNGTGISVNKCTSLDGQKWRGLKEKVQPCLSQ
jgi:hypothetical protein